MQISEEQLHESLEQARQKLFNVREKRIHPYKDDKILTDWNGLMIAALAKAARVFDDSRYSKAAEKAAGFIISKMKTSNGGL
ncbi:MAG: thioredoxin domain-containing protein, partial [Candidatus Dadabacteria bacterium]|nr:thioredoxin domain-containing protein [Candidatus Dadabacteria bacterium]